MSESNGIVWEEPPMVSVPGGGGRRKYEDFFDALRENPGCWALFPRTFARTGVGQIVQTLKRAYGDEFELTQRKHDDRQAKIYARYVGEAS